MYKKFRKLERHHQFMYSLIIGVGLISVWRGVWNLIDHLLLPESTIVSAVLSILFGVAILAITHQKLN